MRLPKLFSKLLGLGSTAKPPDTIKWHSEEPEMRAAKATGQKTLALFFKTQNSPKPNQDHFLVKFELTPESNELIWAGDLKWEGEQLWGRLANNPVSEGYHALQLVRIDLGSIIDWQFYEDGVLQGDFTGRILRDRAP